jgi:maleate cis-trans isomerase
VPTVGVISPSPRGVKAEALIKLLPPEIRVEPGSCNIVNGTRAELERAFGEFEAEVARMAQLGVDLIHPAGVPFLLLGYEGERKLVAEWERRAGVPVFTNGMSQVNALHAYGARRVIAASYFPPADNVAFQAYIKGAGFEVLECLGLDMPFPEVPNVSAETVREFFHAIHRRNPGADAFYVIGPGWRPTLQMIDELEAAFGMPVIHHVPTQSWEIQRRLGFRRPLDGYGRLMRELPGCEEAPGRA